MRQDRSALDTLLTEKRRFPPPPDFAAAARVSDSSVYDSAEDHEAFWAGWAAQLDWFETLGQDPRVVGIRPTPAGSPGAD